MAKHDLLDLLEYIYHGIRTLTSYDVVYCTAIYTSVYSRVQHKCSRIFQSPSTTDTEFVHNLE